MAVLLPFVLSTSWLTGDHTKCHLICKTTGASLFCLLETACREKCTTLISYLEISSLCDSAVVNYVNGTRCYIVSFKTLV